MFRPTPTIRWSLWIAATPDLVEPELLAFPILLIRQSSQKADD
jgi:hypothetical protein